MPASSQTAILIFSRTAREEAAANRYGAGKRHNLCIGKQLIAHTESIARLTGLPVIRTYSAKQRGTDFGERFANAIEDVFALGYASVIAVGTDTPGITAAGLHHICRLVSDDGLAIGPSNDGGTYAIGLSKNNWNKAAFLRVRWQTADVQDDLADYAAGFSTTIRQLRILRDIDNAVALLQWIGSTGRHVSIARSIALALSRAAFGTIAQAPFLTGPRAGAVAHRGPPVMA